MLTGLILLNACSAEQLKNSTYDALYQNECLRRVGYPQCDPEHKPYRDYDQERKRALEAK